MEMEPPLDVMGLEILVDHRCAVVTNGNTSGGAAYDSYDICICLDS